MVPVPCDHHLGSHNPGSDDLNWGPALSSGSTVKQYGIQLQGSSPHSSARIQHHILDDLQCRLQQDRDVYVFALISWYGLRNAYEQFKPFGRLIPGVCCYQADDGVG